VFDTPDLAPMCVGPAIAALAGVLVLGVGRIIAKGFFKKNTTPALSVMIALLVVPFVCCEAVHLNIGVSNPTPWAKPTSNDIVGVWQLSPDMIKMLREDYSFPVPAHALVFKNDGTFYMNQIPNFWGHLSSALERETKYLYGSGTWNIEEQPTYPDSWKLVVHFQRLNVSQNEKAFYFEGHTAPYTLATPGDQNYFLFQFQKENAGMSMWLTVLLYILLGLIIATLVATLWGFKQVAMKAVSRL
jgi:hypothetical protein